MRSKSVGRQTNGGSSVRCIRWRTNNILESYHTALRRHIQVSHPNLFVFLGHLHRATVDGVDYMSEKERLESGLLSRRPRRKQQLKNDCRLQSHAHHAFLKIIIMAIGRLNRTIN